MKKRFLFCIFSLFVVRVWAMEKQHPLMLRSLAIENIVSMLEKETANKIRPFLRGGRKKKGALLPVEGSLSGGRLDQIKNLPSPIVFTIIIRLIFNANKFNKKDKQSFIQAMKVRGGITQYEEYMLDIIKKFIGKSKIDLFNLVAPVDNKGKTFLHFMAKNNNIDMFQFLLKHGVKLSEDVINARDDFGKTLLHEAAYFMHKETSKLLIELGAERYAQDSQKRTPLLFLFSQYDKLLGVKYEKSDEKEIKEWQRIDRIRKVIDSDGIDVDIEFIKLLIGDGDEARKVVNIVNDRGMAPLHYSVSYYSVEMAKLLIDSGADVNTHTTTSGHTPLHLASMKCRGDMVHLLLVYGAEKDTLNLRQRTPYVLYENNVAKMVSGASQKVNQSCENVGLLLNEGFYRATINGDFALLRFGSSDHRIYIREHLKWDPEGWKGNPNMFRF